MAQVWAWHEGKLVPSGSRKGVKHRACGAGDHTSAGRQVVQEQPDRILQPDRNITLEDIKGAAINQISIDSLRSANKRATLLFDQCYKTDEMDRLLWTSLLYYDTLQQHKEASRNDHLSLPGVAGENARQILCKAEEQLNQCEVNFGHAYSQFLLGVERWSCDAGRRCKVSKTHIDRMFYEILYEFLLLTAWICFGYKNWETIQNELGKCFRTSAFNRDIQRDGVEASLCVEIEGLGAMNRESDEYIAYRVHYDRPPVGLLRRLRSPALTSVLPAPEGKSKVLQEESQSWSTEERLGIIGDQFMKYDSQTLQRLEKQHVDNDVDSHIVHTDNDYTLDNHSHDDYATHDGADEA